MLTANRQGEKTQRHPHYLKSTVYCGRCASRLGFTRSHGNGGDYDYFFCLGRQRGNGCRQRFLGVDAVEQAVERLYATVRLDPARADEIRDTIRHTLDRQAEGQEREAQRQRRRLARLADERTKLLHAHYEGAVPLDLLKSEQERIAAETAQAEARLAACQSKFVEIEDTLTKALALLANCQDAYRRAKYQTRRELNQFFFERLLISDDSVVDERPASFTGRLRAFNPADYQGPEAEHPDRLSEGQGVNIDKMVDLGCHYANTPTVAAPTILLAPPNTVFRRGDGDR